jgi:pumilio RNA-binding family
MDQYLIKDFVSMSMDKYGSNVAEKAIIYAGPSWRKRLWEEEVSISER